MKKIVLSLLLLISFISYAFSSFAIETGTYELYSKGVCEYLLNYQGKSRITEYVVYNKNGKEYPAYCLNVERKGVDSNKNYSVNVSDKLYDVNVWRTILNGYPYKSIQELGVATKEEAFTATKQAIYVMQGVRNMGDYSPVNSDAGRRTYNAFVNIINNARNSKAVNPGKVDVEISTQDLEWNYNNGYVEKTFEIKSNIDNGTYDVTLVGKDLPKGIVTTGINNELQSTFSKEEKFKIRIPVQSLTYDGSFIVRCDLTSKTFPVLYGMSGNAALQDYALTYETVEKKSCEYEISFKKNLTKINILKKEYESEKVLENVEFELYNEAKSFNKKLVTNKDGKICVGNLLPGKYFLKEIKTLDGYNLISDIIEINVQFNEEVNVTVNNTKISKELYEKKYENLEVVEKDKEIKIDKNIENTSIENDYTYVKTQAKTTNKLLPKTGY